MAQDMMEGGRKTDHSITGDREGDTLEAEELDQAGNVVTSYVASGKNETGRIDVVVPKRTNTWAMNTAKDVFYFFLPAGYPHSVTSDYLEYQIYDSLQAFSSTIASLLASRAVLEGIGVGDADATSTNAIFLSILQTSLGRLATILFAHRLGTSLEPECKMYRLSADIFNDSAMIVDCLSPVFPPVQRVVMYGISSICRALCGVTGGSSKASLSAHFAKWGNLGELNAKDSSQETIISLLGIFAGTIVVSCISSPFATWIAMIILLTMHLGTNYLAVRAVCMTSLNRQRANILFSHFLSTSPLDQNHIQKQTKEKSIQIQILTPKEVALAERIFEWDGVLRWNNASKTYGTCIIGVELQSILREIFRQDPTTNSFTKSSIDTKRIFRSLQTRGYLLWYSPTKNRFQITLSSTSTVKTQLLAWFHALLTAREIHSEKVGMACEGIGQMELKTREFIRGVVSGRRGSHELKFEEGELGVDDLWAFLDATGVVAAERFEELWSGLGKKGWDLETGAMETKSGTRVKTSLKDDGEEGKN